MIVVLATSNDGKRREFDALAARVGWSIVVPDDYRAPAEDGATYAENAAVKARALARDLRARGDTRAVLADDSGLEIATLGGRPGIHSARYGPEGASWAQRREALLAEMRAAPEAGREARFVCALHLVTADDVEVAIAATYDGSIAHAERGDGGFSYDAIFLDPETGRTFAELTAEEKDAKSHRARAFRRLVDALHGRRGIGGRDDRT